MARDRSHRRAPPRAGGEAFARAGVVVGLLLLASGLGCGFDEATDAEGGGSGAVEGSASGQPGIAAETGGDDEVGTAAAAEIGRVSGDSVFLVDDAGREVVLARPPRRVVSLVPSASEILLALGAGDRIVARTQYDSVPALRELPSVGGGLHPNLERLVAMDPDLVIRFAGPSDRETPARLTELGIPHLAVRPDGMEDVRRIVRMLGWVTAAPDRADSLVARMDSALTTVRERVGSRPPRNVAFVLGGSPPWVAGPGTFVDELLRIAGGRNVFSDLGDLYGPVSREAFVSRPVDLVVTSQREELEFVPEGVPVHRVSPDVETPGLDLGGSARILARILHPEAFR